jgi:hypothetical protein
MIKKTQVLKVTTGEILIFKDLDPQDAVYHAFLREKLRIQSELPQVTSGQGLVKGDGNRFYVGDYVSLD